ncbi:MAG: ZIP family metal transporter [Oscillospiraceae bacterium]|nr:ZIP family metal transporter [Oscillospiraceae bacterium]
MRSFLWAAGGLGFVFLMTCLGSAAVFLFRKAPGGKAQKMILGFAAGVMVAASVFSLLIPAIEASQAAGRIGWIPAAIGFALGVAFLVGLDRFIAWLQPRFTAPGGISAPAKRTTLLVSAVTIHNIPEGMAVGLSFALAAQGGKGPGMYAAAALAIGIGIQDIPEGAAVSLPMRHEGMKPWNAFWLGCLSGLAEPVFGFATVALAAVIAPVMPWLLAFAAGAMLYVTAAELIPEAHTQARINMGALSVMAGFLVMMILDVALG